MPTAKKTAAPLIPTVKDASNTQSDASKKRSLEEDQDGQPGNAGKRVKTAADTADGSGDVEEEEGKDDEGEGENEDEDDSMPLGGNFDLYDMNLDFLSSKYSPAGKKDVEPEALYRTILTYQAKNDRTAKVTIPDDYSSPSAEGDFSARFLRDPFSEEPFEISVLDIEIKEDIGFKSKFVSPKVRWEGEGIKARMEISGGGCGIASSSGSFVMRPLWWAETDDGDFMELFEGTLTFRASFSSMYTRKGHGRGIPTVSFPFWAVRALD